MFEICILANIIDHTILIAFADEQSKRYRYRYINHILIYLFVQRVEALES